jgi:hypothetical protein
VAGARASPGRPGQDIPGAARGGRLALPAHHPIRGTGALDGRRSRSRRREVGAGEGRADERRGGSQSGHDQPAR